MTDRYGIWSETRQGCMPAAADWMRGEFGGSVLCLSKELAEAMAEAANRVDGKIWKYEARELPLNQ